MLDGVKVILVLVVAGVVGGSVLDLFVQFLFQLFVVLFCAPDVPILGRVHGLPGYLRGAGEQNGTGRKCRHDQHQEQKKNAHDHQNVCVALCKIGNAVDGSADSRLALINDLLYTGLSGRCTAGCDLLPASGLCCGAARPGSSIVAFANVLFLPPPGKPVGTTLAAVTMNDVGLSCILYLVRLMGRRFCSSELLFCLELGFLLELTRIAAFGKIRSRFFCFQSLVESLRADIIILILVNFPVSRRPGNGRSVHLSFLGFCHAGCFVRGDLGFAKA